MSVLTKTSLLVIAVLALLDVVWMTLGGFSFVWSGLVRAGGATSILLGFYYYYKVKRAEENIAAVILWTAILIAFSVVAVLSSYLFASLNFSFRDSAFVAFDQAIGVDWLAMVRFVEHHPWLGAIMKPVYLSSMPLIAFTMIYLGLTGRKEGLEVFLTSLLITCLVTIFLSGLLAAKGPYASLNVPLDFVRDFKPVVSAGGPGSTWFEHVMGLRDGSYRLLDLAQCEGIITFPSFHAVMSVLMILALWGEGGFVRLAVFFNMLILITVPLEGNHYLADILAGSLLAVGVWAGLTHRHRLAEIMLRRTFWRPAPWLPSRG